MPELPRPSPPARRPSTLATVSPSVFFRAQVRLHGGGEERFPAMPSCHEPAEAVHWLGDGAAPAETSSHGPWPCAGQHPRPARRTGIIGNRSAGALDKDRSQYVRRRGASTKMGENLLCCSRTLMRKKIAPVAGQLEVEQSNRRLSCDFLSHRYFCARGPRPSTPQATETYRPISDTFLPYHRLRPSPLTSSAIRPGPTKSRQTSGRRYLAATRPLRFSTCLPLVAGRPRFLGITPAKRRQLFHQSDARFTSRCSS